MIRVLGPVLLRNVLGGGNSPGTQRTNTGTSVMSASPFGDNDEEDDSETKSTNSNSRVSISLPTFPDDDEEAEIKTSSSSPTSTITKSGGGVNATTASIVTTTISSLENEVTASLWRRLVSSSVKLSRSRPWGIFASCRIFTAHSGLLRRVAHFVC